MKYQNRRGGRIVLRDIKAPRVHWNDHLHALKDALEMEKKINEDLLNMNQVTSSKNDAHLVHYLASEFLDAQVEEIYKLSTLITNAKRFGDGFGVYRFDIDAIMNKEN